MYDDWLTMSGGSVCLTSAGTCGKDDGLTRARDFRDVAEAFEIVQNVVETLFESSLVGSTRAAQRKGEFQTVSFDDNFKEGFETNEVVAELVESQEMNLPVEDVHEKLHDLVPRGLGILADPLRCTVGTTSDGSIVASGA